MAKALKVPTRVVARAEPFLSGGQNIKVSREGHQGVCDKTGPAFIDGVG
jgi:hypothetical protein